MKIFSWINLRLLLMLALVVFLFAFTSYSVGFVLAVTVVYAVILILVFRDKHSLVELETELDFRQNYDPETNLFNVDRLYLDIQELTPNLQY